MTEHVPDHPDFNQEAIAIWDRIAEAWHEELGEEGNEYTRYLLTPTTARLLDIQPGETALDIACGSGQYSRLMAEAGANVLGIDISEPFLKIARSINARDRGNVEYQGVDATDYDQLIALGEEKFDAINSTMGLMNLSSLTPLARALPKLLKPGGRFVFVVPHPAFNRYTSRLSEERDLGDGTTRQVISTSDYLDSSPLKGKSIPGQLEPKWDFDRPIAMLLNTFFDHGLVLDRLEEPIFPDEVTGRSATSFPEFRQFPPVFFARLRRV